MKNSEKIKYIDLRDAAENLALSQHYLVRELLKLGSMFLSDLMILAQEW